MLKHLQIRQFAIIDDLSLEFDGEMTVLSGETGAGKSILLDALGLLLGDRADVSAIRTDASRAEISAEFMVVADGGAQRWLERNDLLDLDEKGICNARRVLTRDGRTRCYINSRPVAARDLKALGEYLVDIHGQHAHQKLFRRQAQQQMLDEFGVPSEPRTRVAELAGRCRELQQMLNDTGTGQQNRDRQELLRFQVDELNALQLGEGELDELDGEQRRLANAERLLQDGEQVIALLYEGEEISAHAMFSRANELLRGLQQLEDGFTEAAELGESAAIQAREAADSIRRQLDHIEPDPERLEAVERRLAIIHDLARKHHVLPAKLNQHRDVLGAELEKIENAAGQRERTAKELAAALEEYRGAAVELSRQRRAAAPEMAKAITRSLQELGMPEGRFNIRIDAREDDRPHSTGADRVEFEISANAGQPPRPLARVASGGELSRISLAIQVNAIARSPISTMIFDEVDVGIGGAVAEIVGRLLRTLARDAQVLCVTHLPQVAAQANHHLFVRKETTDEQTRTLIEHLEETARVEELARMLGGVHITRRTRAHAREMMEAAKD